MIKFPLLNALDNAPNYVLILLIFFPAGIFTPVK
jgi:hypothetical protein